MRVALVLLALALIMSAHVVPESQAQRMPGMPRQRTRPPQVVMSSYRYDPIKNLVYVVHYYVIRQRRGLSDIIGLDKTKLDDACDNLDAAPQNGLDLPFMQKLFRAVDKFSQVEGADTLVYCSKKAAGAVKTVETGEA